MKTETEIILTKNKKLSIHNLCAHWNKKNILNGVDFEINPGEFLCLCGPNGAGKSTLLNCLSGIEFPGLKKNTSAYYGEAEIDTMKSKQRSKIISYLPQSESLLWNYSVLDTVINGRYNYSKSGIFSVNDYEICDDLMNQLEINHLKNRGVMELSGGEFQKVRIARCLVQKTDFVLLDEPCGPLDFSAQSSLMKFLKNYAADTSTGIICSVHDLNMAARFADKIYLISEGKNIDSGIVSKVFTNENLSSAYKNKLRIFVHPEYKCIQVCDEL